MICSMEIVGTKDPLLYFIRAVARPKYGESDILTMSTLRTMKYRTGV